MSTTGKLHSIARSILVLSAKLSHLCSAIKSAFRPTDLISLTECITSNAPHCVWRQFGLSQFPQCIGNNVSSGSGFC